MRWLALLVVCLPCLAWPCAVADVGSLQTHIRGEEALVVFDEAKGMEHFIRSAEFLTEGGSFGFIVPTPSEPQFAEFDADIFAKLASAYEAARPETRKLDVSSMFLLRKMEGHNAIGGLVQVLSSDRVAGMDVTVVKASDATALSEWLAKHGFTMRPALQTWLDSYVKQGWVFSAFKYEGAPKSSTTSKAVRISFPTKVPIYPYREPSDSSRRAGMQVWVVAPQARTWKGHAPFMQSAKLVLPSTIESLVSGPKVVTLFDDLTEKRPDADVEFLPSASTSEILIPRVVPVTIPLEGLCCVLPVVVVAVLVFRRRKRQA
ncbi:MAG: DUF2330 domain-containing protein [Archangium sp.]|nr:DUF2330 domain-containing protein [Archangium sp.]